MARSPSRGTTVPDRPNRMGPTPVSGFRAFLVAMAIAVPVVGVPTAGMVYKAKYGPKEVTVYKDKVVYKEPGGDCMLPSEKGTVQDVGTQAYAVLSKEGKEATQIDTRVTFMMPDGKTRLCNWDFKDLSNVVNPGMEFTAMGGERIM